MHINLFWSLTHLWCGFDCKLFSSLGRRGQGSDLVTPVNLSIRLSWNLRVYRIAQSPVTDSTMKTINISSVTLNLLSESQMRDTVWEESPLRGVVGRDQDTAWVISLQSSVHYRNKCFVINLYV